MPNPDLPTTISPGDPGHITHSETLHGLVNHVDTPFDLLGDGQGLFSARPVSPPDVTMPYLWWSTDQLRYSRWDGAAWQEVGLVPPSTAIATRYAAPWGNNSNDGLSWGAPKLTIAAAVTALGAAGGEAWFAGSHTTTAPIVINAPGTSVLGLGREYVGQNAPSEISNTTTDVFTISAGAGGLYGLRFEGFRVAASGGDIFHHTSSTPNTGTALSTWTRLTLEQTNSGKCIWNQADQVYIDNTWSDCFTYVTAAHTVPAFFLSSSVAGVAKNRWQNMRCQNSGFFHFLLRSTVAAGSCNDNVFRDINFEEPTGGCILLESCSGTIVENCTPYDLSASVLALRPMFATQRYATTPGPNTIATQFRNIRQRNSVAGMNGQKMFLLATSTDTSFYDCDGDLDAGNTANVKLWNCPNLVVTNLLGIPAHTVGAAGEPAFQNSWVNYGGAFATAQFWRDETGSVHLQGTVKNGTGLNTAIFTLPVGYRPSADMRFAVESFGAVGFIYIAANGVVQLTVGNVGDASLDGIVFRAV